MNAAHGCASRTSKYAKRGANLCPAQGVRQTDGSTDFGAYAAADFSADVSPLNAMRTAHRTRCRCCFGRRAFLCHELHLSSREIVYKRKYKQACPDSGGGYVIEKKLSAADSCSAS
ncbi:MAG: hypothetical protein ACLGI6_11415 [Gammaproteobacteria bacterium]